MRRYKSVRDKVFDFDHGALPVSASIISGKARRIGIILNICDMEIIVRRPNAMIWSDQYKNIQTISK
jgi:hypothetical protein